MNIIIDAVFNESWYYMDRIIIKSFLVVLPFYTCVPKYTIKYVGSTIRSWIHHIIIIECNSLCKYYNIPTVNFVHNTNVIIQVSSANTSFTN